MPPRASTNRVERIDVHEVKATTERVRKRIENGEAGISKKVAREILTFVDSQVQLVSPMRLLTYLRNLPLIAQRIGEEHFLHPTEKTPAHFLAQYRQYQGWTIMGSGAIAMKFWKWRFAQTDKEYPTYLSVRVSKKVCAKKDPTTVITPEEVARIVSAATTLRDKALVSTLYESGTRIGELLSLRVRDVERTEFGGLRLHVDGKTGMRTVPLFESAVPHLSAWLASHPRADDGNAPLWCGLQATERLGEPMTYAAFAKVIRLAARRAGVEKSVNPHAFRHSRATEVAKNSAISTAILEQFFGWEHGSPMAATYVHLNGHEVEEAMARAVGKEKTVAPAVSSRLPVKCPRCAIENEASGKFCTQCGAPLSSEAVGKMLAMEANAAKFAELLRKPAVAEYLAQQLAEMVKT